MRDFREDFFESTYPDRCPAVAHPIDRHPQVSPTPALLRPHWIQKLLLD